MSMTPPPSLNPKQALFVREHATGLHKNGKAAAIAAGYAPSRAHVTASVIMARDDAREYFNQITGKATEEAAEQLAMTKIDLANFYASIIQAKPGSASHENPLCDTVITKEGVEHTLPSKLKAAEGLASAMGWNRPTEDGTTKLAGALESILTKRDV